MIALVGLLAVSARAAVNVSNVSAVQRPGTKLVDITYDVSCDTADAVYVTVYVSNGASRVSEWRFLSGDVNYPVTTGTGKLAVWDGGADARGTVSSNAVITVWASVIPPSADTAARSWAVPGERWVRNIYANGDETLSDASSSRMWVYARPDCWAGFASAQSFSDTYVLAGYTDWRTPDLATMQTLYGQRSFFSGVESGGRYWTSTAHIFVLFRDSWPGDHYSSATPSTPCGVLPFRNHSYSPPWHADDAVVDIDLRNYIVTIASEVGTPDPPVGAHAYSRYSPLTCSAPSVTTNRGVTYYLTGWTGTGSAPAGGSANTTGEFTLTNVTSAVTWNWIFTDTDLDGLPDEWEQLHFGNLSPRARPHAKRACASFAAYRGADQVKRLSKETK